MGAYALLHDRCAPIWSRAAAHPMVQAIGDGSLPHKTFRYYFEQNILYLQNYARAISLVLAKAPDAEAIDLLGQFVRGESERELPMNYDFLHRLGGDPHATDYTEMSAANHAYSQHMLATTSFGGLRRGPGRAAAVSVQLQRDHQGHGHQETRRPHLRRVDLQIRREP